MKKGFTMIELIFVIVILGILAAVAIPRLAGTRADAEITSTIANIRTFLSDAATFYVAKGSFMQGGTAGTGLGTNNANPNNDNYVSYAQFTNVPLYSANNAYAKLTNTELETTKASTAVAFGVGGKGCIKFRVIDPSDIGMHNNRTGVPNAVIIFNPTGNNSSLCNAVRNAEAVKAFTENKLLKADGTAYTKSDFNAGQFTDETHFGAIGIGASASVYDINFSGTN